MIRPFAEADVDAVVDVWQRAASLAHPFLTAEFQALERERIRTIYVHRAEIWVCEHGGAVVGFVALRGDEVGGLFVAPAHHGHGHGRALMDKALELRGAVELEVFEANAIGRTFYERYGFEIAGRYTHEETGQPALRMRYPRQQRERRL